MENFPFLTRIQKTLDSLWGKVTPQYEPLKVVSPKSPDQMAEDELIAKRHNYIRAGARFSQMSPEEEALLGSAPVPPPTQAPSPTPTPAAPPQSYAQQLSAMVPQPTVALGTGGVMAYLASQMPQNGQNPQEYYPALGDAQFMAGVDEADKMRQGLAALLLLQSFNESTLGRADNGGNYFGTLPGGESSGQSSSFHSASDALNYQLSPAVLGGGANPNMNILNSRTPLTAQDIINLYSSYNPNSPYLDTMLRVLFPEGR